MVRRDLLDYGTWALAAALLLWAGLLAGPGAALAPRGAAPVPAPAEEPDTQALAIREALGRYPPRPEDLARLLAFAEERPGSSRAYRHLGSLYLDKGMLAESARNFRRALDLDHRYVDESSPLYAGREMRRLVDDGLRVYAREKELRPDDPEVRATIKNLYVIQRSLAGGCS
jgi:tetratricopeptide (TPR) repeat protein